MKTAAACNSKPVLPLELRQDRFYGLQERLNIYLATLIGRKQMSKKSLIVYFVKIQRLEKLQCFPELQNVMWVF